MKKKYLVSIFIFTLVFFISCSNSNENLSYEYSDSIKNELDSLKNFSQWNASIDEDTLFRNITQNENFAKRNVSLNPSTVKVIKDFSPQVFPSVKGFVSLDTSLINEDAMETLNNFLTSFARGSFLRSQYYFDDSYVFNLVFFINDLKENWSEKFSTNFPDKDELLFENWYIGKGEYSENILKIPLRLFCADGFVDITSYINYSKSNKLFQIHIDSWGGLGNEE